MTVKQFVKNISWKNFKFILQSIYLTFIRKQYEKYFTENRIETMMYKAAKCPECFLNGSMKCCGCPFMEAVQTNKECKNGKF